MSDKRASFLKALEDDPDDNTTRLVYSDWLDERGEHEEAERMRNWAASKVWMLDWVRSINYGTWEYDEDSEYLLDEQGQKIPAKKDNLGDPHTLEDAIQAGRDAVSGDGYCWGTDEGQDYFFNQKNYKPDKTAVREWFKHWSILTGVDVTNIREIVQNPPFRCAC